MRSFKQFFTESKDDNIKVDVTYWDDAKTKLKSEIWNKDGKLHRLDGSAYQSWYKNGQKKYEAWYKDDEFHRLDGPAYQEWNKDGQKTVEEYHINGKEYSKEEFYKIVGDIGRDQLKDFEDMMGGFE